VRTLAVAALLAACGAASTPPASKPAASAPPAKEARPSQDRTAAIERKHGEFKNGCMTEAGAEDYCECLWAALREHVTDEEIASDKIEGDEAARDREINEAGTRKCSEKIPEALLRDRAVSSCMNDDPSLGPFCTCFWSDLVKSLSRAQLTDPEAPQSPATLTAQRQAAKRCSDKVPGDLLKKGFLESCTKQPSYKPFCECTWKAMSRKLSMGEIITLDVETKGPLLEQSAAECESKRPKK
jgi:hypothetical protein